MATHYRFARDYDHPVSSQSDIAYRAGSVVYIPEDHAARADAAGAGQRLDKEAALVARAELGIPVGSIDAERR